MILWFYDLQMSKDLGQLIMTKHAWEDACRAGDHRGAAAKSSVTDLMGETSAEYPLV